METLLIVGYAIGMIAYFSLDKIGKHNNKSFYNIKPEYKKFKSIKDEVNQSNNGWFKK